jgi:hypothetical protein
MARPSLALAPILALFVAAGLALAQPRSAEVTFELGFGGEVVAGAWNPLRVLVRDLPGSTLEVWLDQGSLRQGVVPLIYRADLTGGTGLTLFEDDLYIPAWNALTWAVRSEGATVASGSLSGRRHLDERPIHLLLTQNPGSWRDLYGIDARLAEIPALGLPERSAAYDGVASLLIDGTAVAPRLGAVAAAATAGVDVYLVDELPASHADLILLAPGPQQRLGAGWLLRGEPRRSAVELPGALRVDVDALLQGLRSADPDLGPEPLPQLFVLAAAAAYSLLVLVLVRFAGTPGLLAGLGLAAVVSLAAWRTLRPAQPLERASVILDIGGGDLAQRLGIEHLFSLPEGPVELAGSYRPLHVRAFEIGPDGTALQLQRWQGESLIARPQLVPATLTWSGSTLINRGDTTLEELVVRGLGPQPPLAAGGRADAVAGEERPLSPTMAALLDLAPVGSALAQVDGRYLLALPPRDATVRAEVLP